MACIDNVQAAENSLLCLMVLHITRHQRIGALRQSQPDQIGTGTAADGNTLNLASRIAYGKIISLQSLFDEYCKIMQLARLCQLTDASETADSIQHICVLQTQSFRQHAVDTVCHAVQISVCAVNSNTVFCQLQ